MLRAFTRDMVTYLPSKLLPALTGFISAPILTRLFLPSEYANYVLALGISDFLFALAISGLASVPVRFYPNYKIKLEQGTFFATLSGSIGVVIAVVSAFSMTVLWLLKEKLPRDLYPLLQISVLIFITQALYIVFIQVMRAQNRSGLYTVFELLTRYGSLGLGLLLVIVFGFWIDGLLWGFLLALALTLPFLVFLTTRGVRIRRKHIRSTDAFHMWRYAWPLALGNMAMWGLRLSDRYVISFFRSESEVGLYSVAYNLSGKSIDMLVALFLLSMGPMVMNMWETQGREDTEKSLAMISRLFLVLCIPAVVGLSLLALPFVSLLTAETYHEGYRIVGYIACSSLVWGLSQIVSMGILIKKQTRRIAVNQIIAASVNLGLNLLLVPRFGFIAAGFNTLAGYSVLFVLQAYASRSHLTWRLPLKTLRNVLFATGCMGFAILSIHSIYDSGSTTTIGYLLLSISVAVPVYFIALLLLGELNGEEKATVERFWSRLVEKTRMIRP